MGHLDNLVQAIGRGNLRAAGKELDAAMKERVGDQLNTRKIEVASELMSNGDENMTNKNAKETEA